MATLIWLGTTSTDSNVLANWKDQSTGSAPSSIAITDDFLFNGDGGSNPCLFRQATIATLTTAAGWNARITFDSTSLSLTALNFLADSEIAFSNASTVFTFNGNHITTTPFFNHPVVFGGNITYAGSNGRETVSWVFNNNNSDPSFLCDGLYPKITINAIFTTDVSANVSNTTTGKVECISMTMSSTGKFTNTNLSASSTQKHIHITSSNLAAQHLIIENDVFDMRNAKLTLTAANSLKIPCTNDTTNYSGSKTTFFANLGDVVLATGASSGLKMFVPNGLTLECNSLEIQNGVFLLGGEEPNAASEIHLVKKPKLRGTWNFKPITDGIYRSFGRASQSMFALTAKEAHITDKLTVDGLIDPTGMEFTPVAANPGGVAANTLWLNSGDSNKLYHGSSEVGGGGGGSGTVTNIATSAPITGGAITSTGTIGISAATTSAAGSMSSADKTKLDGIQASADVTDSASVTAAGALMDSEVTNLAQVKAFDSADYATAAQGALADTSLQDPAAFATAAQGAKADSAQQPPSEGAFANGDKTKLDGIATGATATPALQHFRLRMKSNSNAVNYTVTGSYTVLDLANTSIWEETTTGAHADIVLVNDTNDHITLSAGGIYQIVVSVEFFPTSSQLRDMWLVISTDASSTGQLGTDRLQSLSTSAVGNVQLKHSVVYEIPNAGSDTDIYFSLRSNGNNSNIIAFGSGSNRTSITVTRIGDAIS